jgi:polyisoprenoid-binding protein YceI
MITRRAALFTLFCLMFASTTVAAPTRYRLDKEASRVGFTYRISNTDQSGTMPIQSADIVVDPQNLALASVDIVLSAAGVRTPMFLATQALTGSEILDMARYPTIRFVSTKVTLTQDGRLSGGAFITGRLTLRDVTRSVQLKADFYRQPGSARDDFSQLTVRLSGQLDRFDYGASGYAKMVGNTIKLNISVLINAEK